MKTKLLLPTLFLLIPCFITFTAFSQTHPVIGGYNVYYGSLHNHSRVSDGQGTPAEAYAYARNTAKLDFFGLSDHSYLINSSEWNETKNAANLFNQDGAFAAFHGFEWTTVLSYGHVTVVNTTDYLSSGTFTQLVSWVNARNCIAFFNHPGWESTAFQEFNHFTGTPSNKFVGMELWNDHDGFSKYYYNDGYYGNDGGKGYFDEALIRKWQPGAAGGDDNHTATWGTATEYRVGVLANSLNRASILEAFNARRFFATEDKNLSLSFTLNGAEMGSTIPGGSYEARITARDGDNETFTEVWLFKNGSILKNWVSLASLTSTGISETGILCNSGDYFYVKVRQLGMQEAISSPIFISGAANQPPAVTITSPANGATFSVGQAIGVTANASDPDGSVVKVDFFRDGTLDGTDDASPFGYSWASATVGNHSFYAIAYDNMGASAQSATVSVTVTGQVTPGEAESSIKFGSDDAEESKTGAVDLLSAELKLVYDTKITGNQTVGLLFGNLGIPQGATITKAYIQFTPIVASSGKSTLTIRGEASDNSVTFNSTARNLSSRIKTTAGVSWPQSVWSLGSPAETPDIKSVVQEIVNRSGWTETSNLVILITGTGTRTAASFETGTAGPPMIHIDYTLNKSASLETISQPMPEEEVLTTGGISAYPNPVNDILTIRFNPESEVEQIWIYSMTGSLVKTLKYNHKLAETQIDCSSFNPGTYLLAVQTKQGRTTIRFIKQ